MQRHPESFTASVSEDCQRRQRPEYRENSSHHLYSDQFEHRLRTPRARAQASTRVLTSLGKQGKQQNSGGSRSPSRRGDEVTGRSTRQRQERQERAARRDTAGRETVGGGRLHVHLAVKIAAVLAVLAIAVFVVYMAPSFTITNVQVEGANYLQASYIKDKVAGSIKDNTLLRIDTSEVAARVLTEPWVASVQVKRHFPSTLVLQVSERQPIAAVALSGAETKSNKVVWALSNDGVWLGEVKAIGQHVQGLDPAKLIQIVDVSPVLQPSIGGSVAEGSSIYAMMTKTASMLDSKLGTTVDAGVANALRIIDGFSVDMRTQVTSISAPDTVRTMLYLNNKTMVAIGSADDVTAKEAAIKTIIRDHGADISYINVRVPDRASYRLTDSSPEVLAG